MRYGIWKLVMQNLKNPRSTSTSSQRSEANPTLFGVRLEPMPDLAAEDVEVKETVQAAGAPHTGPDAAHRTFKINRTRYYRIVLFFSFLFLNVLAWEFM